jgi:TPP-dependent pyruvate/acetoin dehydrogenase alpha subunit
MPTLASDTPQMAVYNISGRELPTAQQLIDFEADIAQHFNNAEIRAPIHLSGGNEARLIEIFADIADEDWVFTTWRSHYHCLLKGVPADRLKADIMAGRSITLNYDKYKIVSSAIVGGIIPIALGVALSCRSRSDYQNKHHKVWCFVGDMAARSGTAHEAQQYARAHALPLRIIVEDNGKSVETPTEEVWGYTQFARPILKSYNYELPWPHAGAGKRVEF